MVARAVCARVQRGQDQGARVTVFEEPPNHSLVGWGLPIRGARVRIDDYVDEQDDPLERWYDISAGGLVDVPPITWDAFVARIEAEGHRPVLYSPVPIYPGRRCV